jgi:hypothetical protein
MQMLETIILTSLVVVVFIGGKWAIEFAMSKLKGKSKPESDVERKARLYDEMNKLK